MKYIHAAAILTILLMVVWSIKASKPVQAGSDPRFELLRVERLDKSGYSPIYIWVIHDKEVGYEMVCVMANSTEGGMNCSKTGRGWKQ